MLEAGLSQRAVAIGLGISKGAIYRTLHREKIHSSECSLSRNGRPVAVDAKDHRRSARGILAKPGEFWAHLATTFLSSVDSVRKAVNSLGFNCKEKRRKRFLTAKAIAKRPQWDKDNKGQD
jgi:transposase